MDASISQTARMLEVVGGPLLAQHPLIYVAACCNRVYLGAEPAGGCRTCDKTPDNQAVSSMKELLDLAEKLA